MQRSTGNRFATAFVLAAALCAPAARAADAPAPTAATSPDPTALDPSANPCQDFYRHACGGFLARTKTTSATPMVSMADEQFQVRLEAGLARLFAVPAPAGSELGRLQGFYGSCLHKGPADVAVVRGWLGRIEAARTPAQVQALIRALAAIGVDPFFSYAGQPDPQDLARYRGEIDYSNTWQDPAIVERSFVLAGLAPERARADAASVAAIVGELRKTRSAGDDPSASDNPRTWAQVQALAPAVDWAAYRRMVGAPADRPVNLTAPAYLPTVSHELSTRSPEELRAYLRWAFLFSLRGELPAPFNQAFGDLPAWGRVDLASPARACRDATVRAMGVEFSRQYAEKILGLPARAAAQAIARSIQGEIVRSVSTADWLSPQARAATADKLARTDLKTGFPDRWPATGRFPVERGRFLDNVLRARRFEAQRAWTRAGQARSRAGWEMMVYPWVGTGMAAARLVVPNGFPDAYTNSLIMTAAFLAPPRFDAAAPPEQNYGTFGAVFAHEFVHIAESHEFDADGRMRDIWTGPDLASAKARRQCVIAQAEAWPAPGGGRMDGAAHYDENVADLGGLRLAYEALAARLGPGIDQPDGAGMTPAKRFFYAYAQSWCTAASEAELARLVKDDIHALPAWRVNGPLSNLPAFGRAFSCKAGDAMVRPAGDICRVW